MGTNIDVEEVNLLVDEFNKLVSIIKKWEPIILAVVAVNAKRTGYHILPATVLTVDVINHVEEIPDWWINQNE